MLKLSASFFVKCIFVPMKSKEEILNSYYSHAADGLLKAMEEYREQAEEAAFNAARELNGDQPAFPSFKYYKAALEAKTEQQPKEDTVRLVADSIIEQFLPDDPAEKTFEFNFKAEGEYHTVIYNRN